MVKRNGDEVRIFTRRGADWTNRFPAIVHAARRLKAASFYIDGEGVVCDENGLAVFDRLHSKGYDDRADLYAFDLLEIDGYPPGTAMGAMRRHELVAHVECAEFQGIPGPL